MTVKTIQLMVRSIAFAIAGTGIVFADDTNALRVAIVGEPQGTLPTLHFVFHGDSFNEHREWDKLIGTGPYKLSDWKPGQTVSMTRFDSYVPRSEPKDGYSGAREALLEEIQLVVHASVEDAIAALRAGDVDFVQNVGNRQRADVLADQQLGSASIANVTYWTL